jgi:hypothetical protein
VLKSSLDVQKKSMCLLLILRPSGGGERYWFVWNLLDLPTMTSG